MRCFRQHRVILVHCFVHLFSSERIKRHNTIIHLFCISIALRVGEKGAGLPCVSLPHDVHALFSWTTSALDHVRYCRSLLLHGHGLGFSRRLFPHIPLLVPYFPSRSTCATTCLLQVYMPSFYRCGWSDHWTTHRMDESMYCYGWDDTCTIAFFRSFASLANIWLRWSKGGAKVEHTIVQDLAWGSGRLVFLIHLLICLGDLAVYDESIDRIEAHPP